MATRALGSGLHHQGATYITRAPLWRIPEQAIFRDVGGQPTSRTSSADYKAPSQGKGSVAGVPPQGMIAVRATAPERLGKLPRKDLRQPSKGRIHVNNAST